MPVLLLALLLLPYATACGGQDPAGDDLDAAVDELIPRIEVLSGLQARAPVRVARRDSAELRAYVTEQLTEELPPDELAGITASYRAFGLIPDTLELRRLLLDLYTEQVMGYYDPETEMLYLMEGVSPEALRPVLAHELVHALQDQHVDLDSLISRDRANDRQTAAQAAIEGHATLVMVAVLAEERLGQPIDVGTLPELGAQLRPALEAQNQQFPVFRSAPRVIRETLLFPYLHGAVFVQALWRADVQSTVGAGADTNPPPLGNLLPLSTEQVLHPEERFLSTRDAPTEVELERSNPAPPTAGGASGPVAPRAVEWRTLYENTLGELETRILLGERLGAASEARAGGWDGDRYRLLERSDGGRALVWYSIWDDDAAAAAFAAAYRHILEEAGPWHGRVERLDVDGRPAVRLVVAERSVPLDRVPVPSVARLREADR